MKFSPSYLLRYIIYLQGTIELGLPLLQPVVFENLFDTMQALEDVDRANSQLTQKFKFFIEETLPVFLGL